MTRNSDRLSSQSLRSCRGIFQKPAYNPADHGIGILHLGLGAFHRAHQAVYTDTALAKCGGDWRSVGVSLRHKDVRNQLSPQNGLYTLAIKDGRDTDYKIIGSIADILHAPSNPAAVLTILGRKNIKIVTLSITEKGYCLHPATNRLNREHPDIQHDMINPEAPRSAIGFLYYGLKARFQTHQSPLTIISCDNLPSNGRILEALLGQFADGKDPALTEWIKNNIAFPCTMVDRIVPATTPKDRADFTAATGLIDEGLVKSEPFTQWVIEDRFATIRPEWEIAGAEFVPDVTPYEVAKLRLLNGSHSALAYLGFLGSYTFIHEAMDNPDFEAFVDHLMKKEAAVSLGKSVGLNLIQYADKLKIRYKNTALQHKTYQIAMDGSQKLPQRLLETIRHNIKNNLPCEACSLAVAAWIRYVSGTDENGTEIIIQDPLADKFKVITQRCKNDPQSLVEACLSITDIFGHDLPYHTDFKKKVIFWLNHLMNEGSKQTISYFMQHIATK